MMQEFSGKTAVVTGAGSGMGRAFAQRFAEESMRVVLADIEQAALERAVSELRAAGHDVIGVPTDVSRRESVEHLAERAAEAYGNVHVLCNNAGVEGYLDGAIWEASDNDWQWTMGVNFRSVVHGIQAFLPGMLAHGEDGHVVNTVSMTALVRGGNMYGIAKHAVLALSETMHAELRARGANIGVTALCPGIIATRLFRGSRNRPAELQNETAPPGADQGREIRDRLDARLAQGMPPSQVADILFQAIRDDRFYVLTDHDWDDAIRTRSEDILLGRNPDLQVRGG
jgi:NAD(P)-dependent dehydrogenase (short-subunit alcohol dehydrogenase family)